MSSEAPPQLERVEIPVDRVEVKITMEDVLAALATRTGTLAQGDAASAAGAPGARGSGARDPSVAGRLRRVAELARELQRELDQLRRIDPALADDLHRGNTRR